MGDTKNIGSPPIIGKLVNTEGVISKAPISEYGSMHRDVGSILTGSTTEHGVTTNLDKQTGHVSIVRDGKLQTPPKLQLKMKP